MTLLNRMFFIRIIVGDQNTLSSTVTSNISIYECPSSLFQDLFALKIKQEREEKHRRDENHGRIGNFIYELYKNQVMWGRVEGCSGWEIV